MNIKPDKTSPDIYPYPDRGVNGTPQLGRLWSRKGIRRQTIHLHLYYLFQCVLVPFLEDVIRDLLPQTKRLDRLPMRQRLRLVLKIKTHQIFATIYILLQNFVRNEGRTFIIKPLFECLRVFIIYANS